MFGQSTVFPLAPTTVAPLPGEVFPFLSRWKLLEGQLGVSEACDRKSPYTWPKESHWKLRLQEPKQSAALFVYLSQGMHGRFQNDSLSIKVARLDFVPIVQPHRLDKEASKSSIVANERISSHQAQCICLFTGKGTTKGMVMI